MDLETLKAHGRAMKENGWLVEFARETSNYRWTSPRGHHYYSELFDVPSENAVKSAVSNEDYVCSVEAY
jgi:hypothetical protein